MSCNTVRIDIKNPCFQMFTCISQLNAAKMDPVYKELFCLLMVCLMFTLEYSPELSFVSLDVIVVFLSVSVYNVLSVTNPVVKPGLGVVETVFMVNIKIL